MKENYEAAEVVLVNFSAEDIITTSYSRGPEEGEEV